MPCYCCNTFADCIRASSLYISRELVWYASSHYNIVCSTSTRFDNSAFLNWLFFFFCLRFFCVVNTWLCLEVKINLSWTKYSSHYQIILLQPVHLYHDCIKHCCCIYVVSNVYLTEQFSFAVNHYVAVSLKIVFLPLLAFEIIILIDNFRYQYSHISLWQGMLCKRVVTTPFIYASIHYLTTLRWW